MKKLVTIVTFAAVSVSPVFAQGCGMMGQGASASGGMMCGRPSPTAAQATPAQPGQQGQSAGGCACCRNMAMMHTPGQNQGSTPGMQHNMPSTPSSPPANPASEVPRP